jgi:hypothetical protein
MKRGKKAPRVEKFPEMWQVVEYADARVAKYQIPVGGKSRGFTYEHSIYLAAGVLNCPVFASIPLGAWLLARSGGEPVDAMTARQRWKLYVADGGTCVDGELVMAADEA